MLLAGSPAKERGAKVREWGQVTIKCRPRILSSELRLGLRGVSAANPRWPGCDLWSLAGPSVALLGSKLDSPDQSAASIQSDSSIVPTTARVVSLPSETVGLGSGQFRLPLARLAEPAELLRVINGPSPRDACWHSYRSSPYLALSDPEYCICLSGARPGVPGFASVPGTRTHRM